MLWLETDLFDGHRLQRTHAFNATLAELQGPDGLPISSRVGHTVIHFFPGEHDREYTRFGDIDEAYPSSARLGDEIPVHGGRNACDSDEECSSASSASNSSSDSSEEVNCTNGIIPPRVIISPANATVASSRAPSANFVIEGHRG